MTRHAFIIGGSGQIGYAVATCLISQGWRVTVFCRRRTSAAADLAGRGVAVVLLDRDDTAALSRALVPRADVLIDAVAFDAGHAQQLLALQDRVGALAVISSSSVYCDAAGRSLDEAGQNGFPDFPEPIRETQATVAPGTRTYSARKAALERRLLDAARIPVIILRPGAIHRIHSTHPLEWWCVKRMLDARPFIPLAYGGRSRFHTCASTNLAALIAAALEKPQTRILNAADPQAPDVARIGGLIARHLGYAGHIEPLEIGDERGNAPVGCSPWSVPAAFVLDTNAAAELGCAPAVRYEDAVGPVCDYLAVQHGSDWRGLFPVLAAYPRDLFDYAAEDIFFRT
jgi:nucleoside-diphosphate-sugar epimerase